MNLEKENKILKFLNETDIDDDITIEGIKFTMSDDSSMHSLEVSETLYSEDGELTFTRIGRKEISYERWIDTSWNDWE